MIAAEIAKQDKTDKSEKPANKPQKDGHQKQTDSEKEGKKKDDKILKEQETQKKMDSSNKSEETKKDSKSNTNQSQQGKKSNAIYLYDDVQERISLCYILLAGLSRPLQR